MLLYRPIESARTLEVSCLLCNTGIVNQTIERLLWELFIAWYLVKSAVLRETEEEQYKLSQQVATLEQH